jgi:hypothetical protein
MQGATFSPNRTGEFCEKPAFVKKRIREMASNRIVIFVIDPGFMITSDGCFLTKLHYSYLHQEVLHGILSKSNQLDAGCWMLDAGCWMLDAG